MQIYNYDENGFYIGTGFADESPLEPGVFAIPAYATTIEPPSPQDGQLLKFGSEAWGYVPVTAPDVEPTSEPLPKTKIYKSDIWRKSTDAEAVTIKAGLLQQPVRLQELWQSVSYISTTDELYTALRAGFVAAFGEARTNELLEATE